MTHFGPNDDALLQKFAATGVVDGELELCHCGCVKDAHAVAVKLFKEMIGNNCPVWSLMVSTMLRQMSIQVTITDMTESNAEMRKVGQEVVNGLVRYSKEQKPTAGQLYDIAIHERSKRGVYR